MPKKLISPAKLLESDRQYIWHPFTMWEENFIPIPISAARESLLYTPDGRTYIDAISSWWVITHGHCHPYITKRVQDQIEQLDQVIFADCTHESAVELAHLLSLKLPYDQPKFFFSDNGSTSVEVALKIAIQFHKNKKQRRHRIIAFENAYHGDTFGAMSAGHRGIFNVAFEEYLFDVLHIPVPHSENADIVLQEFEMLLEKKDVAAFIFEPLVQGAGGMVIYDAASLDKMIELCQIYNTISIADEVMTGFGRTGTMFASDMLKHKPDIMCLSKGITGGFFPLGVTVVNGKIFDAFRVSDVNATFWHGHSYTANPIICAAACAAIELFDIEHTLTRVSAIEQFYQQHIPSLSEIPIYQNIRYQGDIFALDIVVDDKKTSYFQSIKKPVQQFFLKHGVYLRPLGNVLYIIPPYCITKEQLEHIFHFIEMLPNEDFMKHRHH